MALPKFVQSRMVIGTLVGLSLLAVVFSVWWNWNGTGLRPISSPGAVFFDESSQEFTRLPGATIPPATGKNGDTLVRAVMRSEEMTPQNVVYLFRFTKEKKTAWQAGGETTPVNIGSAMVDEVDGKEVRLLQAGAKWVPARSEEGQRIISGG